MKKFVFLLVGLCVLASGFGMYQYFKKLNPSQNKNAARPELIVFGTSSFIGPYGPGPKLVEEFEKFCVCDVALADGGGTELLLQKLKMPGALVDVVVGLDQLVLKRTMETVKWRGLQIPDRNWGPIFKGNHYANFLPYDWAPMTFVFRKSDGYPTTGKIADFVARLPNASLVLQDPDLSTPGLQFVLWQKLLPESFVGLKEKVQRLAGDWSAAYGLFKKQQAKATFTYLTSLIYHWDQEKDFSFEVANFDEGHVVQIEYAGVPELCRSCGLAERFVEFLSEDIAQKILMQNNYMLPIVEGVTVGTSYEKLPQLKILPTTDLDKFVDQRAEIVKTYRAAIGRQ